MNPKDGEKFPFVTRKMLAFEEGVSLSLKITARGGGNINLIIRGITKEGLFTFKHNTLSDTSDASRTFRIPDIPIFVSVADESGGIKQGSVFVSLNLLANGQNIYNFFSGLVYDQNQLSWPAVNSIDQIPGVGGIGFAIGADPAAGAEATITVPNYQVWLLKSFIVTLVAANVAVSRRVGLRITSQLSIIYEKHTDYPLTAALTRKYCFANHEESATGTSAPTIAVGIPPNLFLRPGDTISTTTAFLEATDNFGEPVIHYEQFPTIETA